MSVTERLQCVIVDDNARFAAAAAKLLEGQGIEVLGVASYCAEALSMVEELRPDVTLVDVDLGSECGFNLAEQLHRRQSVAILISTSAEHNLVEMIPATPA